MDLTVKISKAEEKYLSSVEAFFKEKWGETKLWSHDLSHHRRVWNYAKELLQYASDTDQHSIEELLIACYFHDIGMSIDPGEKHGILSQTICKLFLEENKVTTADHENLLLAIEYHDNKDYSGNPEDNRVLQLLSVADDLDAFGYMGILRYADIYLKRGVPTDELSRMVLANSARRFKNFETVFPDKPELLARHRERYDILKEFYSVFNNQTD